MENEKGADSAVFASDEQESRKAMEYVLLLIWHLIVLMHSHRRRIVRKADLRIMPLVCIAYLLNYLE